MTGQLISTTKTCEGVEAAYLLRQQATNNDDTNAYQTQVKKLALLN